jgi:ABC-type Na+ transport system ATPase subunit NatA
VLTWLALMLQDQKLAQAVAAIPARSERQQDLQKLVGAFVDVGILPQIRNHNNQVFYGRRGTGKTHILKVLAAELQKTSSCVVYIDARTLGSTAQFSDSSVPLPTRCVSLFRDFLGEIHNGLLDHIVGLDTGSADAALDHLSRLAKVVTESCRRSFLGPAPSGCCRRRKRQRRPA